MPQALAEQKAQDLLPDGGLIRKTLMGGADMSANKFLQGVPLFKRLPESEIPVLAQAMQVRTFEAGETIFRQGDKGDAFYVIQNGAASGVGQEFKETLFSPSGEKFYTVILKGARNISDTLQNHPIT